jgi:HPt (histidine-containing phosphotransfer) domain-containing protein
LKTPQDPSSEIPLDGLEGFVAEFLENRKEELANLKLALNEVDYLSIRSIAHKWRGIAAPYGFGTLGQLATELEQCGEDKELERCKSIASEIESYLATK